MTLANPQDVADILIREFGVEAGADYALRIYRHNPKTEIGQCYSEAWQIIADYGMRKAASKDFDIDISKHVFHADDRNDCHFCGQGPNDRHHY
jgi:hypothetical protein